MHEDTRHRLLRGLFFLTCIFPTLAVVGWGAYRSTPIQRVALQQRLSERLGLQIEIQRLTYPRYHASQLSGVRVVDSEHGGALLSVDRIDTESSLAGCAIRIPEAELAIKHFPRVWERFHQRVIQQQKLSTQLREFSIERLVLQTGRDPLVLKQCHWRLSREDEIHASQLQFHLEHGTEPIRVIFRRDRTKSPLTTQVVLETGSQTVPLALVNAVLGKPCALPTELQGTLPVRWTAGQWQAQFKGRLTKLPLQALTDRWVAHPMSGTCAIDVLRADFSRHRLDRIEGKLRADDLRTSGGLIDSLVQHRLFKPGPAFAYRSIGEFEASLFEIKFWVTPTGRLYLQGIPDEANLKVAAQSERGVELLCDVRNYPIDTLLTVLMPEDGTADSERIAARLQSILPSTSPSRETGDINR